MTGGDLAPRVLESSGGVFIHTSVTKANTVKGSTVVTAGHQAGDDNS